MASATLAVGDIERAKRARTSSGRPMRPNLRRHRSPEIDPPAGKGELRAVRRQHEREMQAQAAERAGDQGGASGEEVRGVGRARGHADSS
jgi:hypothetical protein